MLDDLGTFSGLLTGNLSDAAEALGMPRAVILGSTTLGIGRRATIGRAFTMRQRRKDSAADRGASQVRQFEVSSSLAKAGDFIVIETGGITDVATWGENHSRRCQQRGVVGLLTDGATRDADEIDALGFPVFCAGFSPVKSRWDLETVSIGEPVTIGSVHINVGDYVVADRTGVIVIPAGNMADVVKGARRIRDDELRGHGSSGGMS